MKKEVTLRVPEEMVRLIVEWAQFIPGMEIVTVEAMEASPSLLPEWDEPLLARAIERCQPWFWGKSAYAVVYCVCRDVLRMKVSMAAFEQMVERLSYVRTRDYNCPEGTVSRAFSNNPVYRDRVEEWDRYRAAPRVLKLRDELINALS